MNTLNIPLLYRKIERTPRNYIHLPPDLVLGLVLSGSNYPCLEQIYVVPKMFELLRFDCIIQKKKKKKKKKRGLF